VNEAQLRRHVKVRRIYEVVCDVGSCNGMQDEIDATRQDADEHRETHIQLHLSGAMGDDSSDEFKDGWDF